MESSEHFLVGFKRNLGWEVLQTGAVIIGHFFFSFCPHDHRTALTLVSQANHERCFPKAGVWLLLLLTLGPRVSK